MLGGSWNWDGALAGFVNAGAARSYPVVRGTDTIECRIAYVLVEAWAVFNGVMRSCADR